MEADTDRVGVERFNDLLTRLVISDLRGQGMHEPGTLGHAAGASGAFEAVAAALTVHHGLVPTLGDDVEVDPEIDLDLVVGPSARAIEPGPVLSNSFGLGGHNGCIVVGPVR